MIHGLSGLFMSGLVVLAVVACSESREPSAGPPLECEDAGSRPPGNRGAVPANADHIFQPGDPVADVVAGMPVSSVFVFASGTYEAVSVAPKAGQQFIGEPGVVFEGQGAPYAFRSDAPDVTIANLEIVGYSPEMRTAVVHGDQGASGWTVRGNEIHGNGEKGIQGVSEWQVLDNSVHHNGRYGITGSGSGVLLERNEIYCNATEYGATGDSGGTKFVHTTDLVLRDNDVHDNYGNGLWVDINNVDALIEGNRLLRNERSGIFLEISCGGVIRSNFLDSNGYGDKQPNWMSGAAIQVALTPNAEVYDNELVDNAMGIGGIQWNHKNVDAVTKCDPKLQNLEVRDNSITQSVGAAAGIDAGNFGGSVWSEWGNLFHDNVYVLSGEAAFRWEGDWVTDEEWRAAGQN